MSQGTDGSADNSPADAPFEWLTNFRSLRRLVLPSRVVGEGPSSARSEDAHHVDVTSPPLQLNALHVGCGTSTAGESLLRLRERTSGGAMRYGCVVNVDNDEKALDSMRRRWEKLQIEGNPTGQTNEMGTMVWKCLDFKSDQSCRSALDGVYREFTQDATCAEPGGCFDLVLDKSTLACLLCAETSVVAQFLCEVYRALRVPAACVSVLPPALM